METFPTVDLGAEGSPDAEVFVETMNRSVELFRKHGCLLVKKAFSPDYIRQLHGAHVETYNPYFKDMEFPDALKVGDKRVMISVDIKGPFNSSQLYANRLVLSLLKQFLGNELILGSVVSVVSLPGAGDQHAHRDFPDIYAEPGVHELGENIIPLLPAYAITVILPLVPLNAINGTTRMWLGSHLVPYSQSQQRPQFDPVAELGDCLLMDYRLLHMGTANRSASVRPILYNAYYRTWFRDSVNYAKQEPVLISDEEYAKIPAQHRYLFSWLRRGIRGQLQRLLMLRN